MLATAVTLKLAILISTFVRNSSSVAAGSTQFLCQIVKFSDICGCTLQFLGLNNLADQPPWDETMTNVLPGNPANIPDRITRETVV